MINLSLSLGLGSAALKQGAPASVPANAIRQRDGSNIQTRGGAYIVTRSA